MNDTGKVIIGASIMLSLAGTGYFHPITTGNGKYINTVAVAKTIDNIYETKAWKEIEVKWDKMNKIKVSDFQDITGVVKKEKQELEKLYEPLVKEGYLSPISADAISIVYCENLRSYLEGTVELPCCYEPVMVNQWELSGIDTRTDLKKKLELLEDCYKKETIKKDIYDKVKKDITKRLSLLDKADKYWENLGEGTCEKHPQETDVLLHLYDKNTGGIKDGKSVHLELIKASEYIVKLEK